MAIPTLCSYSVVSNVRYSSLSNMYCVVWDLPMLLFGSLEYIPWSLHTVVYTDCVAESYCCLHWLRCWVLLLPPLIVLLGLTVASTYCVDGSCCCLHWLFFWVLLLPPLIVLLGLTVASTDCVAESLIVASTDCVAGSYCSLHWLCCWVSTIVSHACITLHLPGCISSHI